MDWLAWNLVPFYIGIAASISFIWWSYRVHFAQHPFNDDNLFFRRKPVRWTMSLIAILGLRFRAYACALALILIGLTQEVNSTLAYVLAGALTVSCALFFYVDHRFRNKWSY